MLSHVTNFLYKVTFHGSFFNGKKKEMEGWVSGKIFCEECGESVPAKKIKRHMLRRHDNREYVCETCGTTSIGYENHHRHKVC